ncbi:MAG: ABC-type nitrate/sulfonate/bicarbonate transport system, permease component [Anaerosporomusa subterranea]|jgi:sulfonate transport system permease protein|nr:ABC-type nitrate/sulfonate/bicarbonate transport system, permease component [Anaerosporomusa subterranea]
MLIGKRLLRGLYLPAILFAIWVLGSWQSLWNAYVIPSPSTVLTAVQQMLAHGTLYKHISVSLYRVLLGFSAAFILAFPLGVLLGMKRSCGDYLGPLLEFVRHVPPLATVPMLILWFGIGETPKLLIVVLATFFPIFLNTLYGVANCDEKWLEVGKTFKLSNWQQFRRIVLPAALPSVLLGMQLGLGYSWRALVGAELIAASSGIGYMILDAEQLSRPDVVVVGILTIGIVGTLIDWLFLWITKRAIPWKAGETSEYGRG